MCFDMSHCESATGDGFLPVSRTLCFSPDALHGTALMYLLCLYIYRFFFLQVVVETSAILSMTFSDSESDEEFGSLLSRIRARKAGKEKPTYTFDSDEGEEEEISARLSATFTVTKTASTQGEPAKKTRRVIKKKPIVLSSDDEDDWSPSEQDDDDDSDFEL